MDIEIVRCTLHNAHVFKLPPRSSAAGWRGADWTEQVWQGSVQVVDKGGDTAIRLVSIAANPDGTNKVFAVCPVTKGAVDKCIDSSRYFVLRIENGGGRHMFIGLAFNERNDAFDFNTSLSDSSRERKAEETAKAMFSNVESRDYSIKEGSKITVAVPKVKQKGDAGGGGGVRAQPRAGERIGAPVEAGSRTVF